MKIDWLKVKYKIKAFFIYIPRFGIRVYPTDRVFDRCLWEKIKTCEPEEIGEYHCLIDNRRIWIANYPCASGHLYEDYRPSLSCSRATALRLHDILKPHFEQIEAEKEFQLEKKLEALRAEFRVD